MPNGKPHDHPLTDILVHSICVYGEEADALIRRVAGLCVATASCTNGGNAKLVGLVTSNQPLKGHAFN